MESPVFPGKPVLEYEIIYKIIKSIHFKLCVLAIVSISDICFKTLFRLKVWIIL